MEEYLQAALEDPNPELFLMAVANEAKARGMSRHRRYQKSIGVLSSVSVPVSVTMKLRSNPMVPTSGRVMNASAASVMPGLIAS